METSQTPEEAAKAALAKKRAARAAEDDALLEQAAAARKDVPPGIEYELAASSVLSWEPSSGIPRPSMNLWQKLAWVQKRLAVPKERGKGHDKNAKVEYSFRNASDILSRAKPLCFAVDAMVTADTTPIIFAPDAKPELVTVRKPYDEKKECPTYSLFGGPWRLLVATATFTDIETGAQFICRSSAEQDNWRKGQSEPEKRSGSTDSYATKYALCHLFAIDDNKDADDLTSDGAIGPKAEEQPW